MWENLVGRSYEFWQHFYPRAQEMFPSQLGNVSLEAFYRGINRVSPSLIRVEADEATYNLHIMLRLELEIALMEGKLAAKDLPEAWNARMQGIRGSFHQPGCRWRCRIYTGLPAYSGIFLLRLGNLMSLQLWEKINIDVPGLSEQIAGKFGALLDWLGSTPSRR
jgi:carboxypeptidase Taq